jgi:two-component system NtrC family sensor kinase
MATRLDADQVDQVGSTFAGEWTRHGHEYFQQLRRKLRWQLLVAYVTPLIVLSVYFHFQYNATLSKGVETHLRSIAENQRNTVDLFLQERISNLRNAFDAIAPGRALTPDEMENVLAGLRGESATFVDVGLFNPDGTLVSYAGPHPSLLGKDYSHESWWTQLLSQERESFVSDVYLGFRGRPHFIIALRRVVEGRPWVLRASLDPEKFGEFVGSSYLMEEAEAFIVNARGQRQTLSGASPSDEEPTFVPERTAESRVLEVDAGGKRYLSAYAWLAEHDWALVVRIPTEKAYAPVRRARLILVAIVLGTLSLLVVLVLRNTQKLVGKLEAADAAKEDLRRQFFHAAKLASVGEMAAGVAHEINNPLAIIHEEAGIMKDILNPEFGQAFDPEDFRERLDVIMATTLRAKTITGNLLDFSRKHDPVLELVDVNDLIEEVLAIRDVEFKVSNIEVSKEFFQGLPPVMAKRNRLEQVLLNLLNNARDAISGPGRVTVRTRLADGYVHIDVEDTGCGMTPEQMEKIFFPFFTTKAVGKGTGLGLSISYGIVKALGGKIEVKSEPGQGSTFTVMLPVAAAAESRTEDRMRSGPARAAG